MGTYTEQYQYDAVGNFLQYIHQGSTSANAGWTRSYTYNEPSLLEAGKVSNRLTQTTVSGAPPFVEAYGYDLHGNMTGMPQLQSMQWNFQDQLLITQRQAVNAMDADGVLHQAERTYYVYDASGQRARKVTERQNGTLAKERLYLGGYEVYREYDSSGTTITLERESLHVFDGTQRICLVETRTQGTDATDAQLVRYQFGNHLGSASLELDDLAQIISYEEYFPYGSTSYQAGQSTLELSLKRYRYTGMERDEESGLNYHSARYYASWLAHWVAPDPKGIEAGANLYEYVLDNPIGLVDPEGTDNKKPKVSGTSFAPGNRGDIGTWVHEVALPVLSARLLAVGIANSFEIPTLPDGSKNIKTTKKGSIDLALFFGDPKKTGEYKAHVYELKPLVPSDYQNYVSEVDHYTEHFPKQVGQYRISDAKIGDALSVLANVAPHLLDPIEIRGPQGTVTVDLALAKDNNSLPIPGLIVYTIRAQRKEKEKEQQPSRELRATRDRQDAKETGSGLYDDISKGLQIGMILWAALWGYGIRNFAAAQAAREAAEAAAYRTAAAAKRAAQEQAEAEARAAAQTEGAEGGAAAEGWFFSSLDITIEL